MDFNGLAVGPIGIIRKGMGDLEATTILVVIASLHKLMVQEFEHGQKFVATSKVVDIGLPHTTIKKKLHRFNFYKQNS